MDLELSIIRKAESTVENGLRIKWKERVLYTMSMGRSPMRVNGWMISFTDLVFSTTNILCMLHLVLTGGLWTKLSRNGQNMRGALYAILEKERVLCSWLMVNIMRDHSSMIFLMALECIISLEAIKWKGNGSKEPLFLPSSIDVFLYFYMRLKNIEKYKTIFDLIFVNSLWILSIPHNKSLIRLSCTQEMVVSHCWRNSILTTFLTF